MSPSRPVSQDLVPFQTKCRKQLPSPQVRKDQWPQERMLEMVEAKKIK